jgi:hypothetical protein
LLLCVKGLTKEMLKEQCQKLHRLKQSVVLDKAVRRQRARLSAFLLDYMMQPSLLCPDQDAETRTDELVQQRELQAFEETVAVLKLIRVLLAQGMFAEDYEDPPEWSWLKYARQCQEQTSIVAEGVQMVVAGLSSKPELNGNVVTILEYNSQTERYKVQFEDNNTVLALKREKLEELEESDSNGNIKVDLQHPVSLEAEKRLPKPLQQTLKYVRTNGRKGTKLTGGTLFWKACLEILVDSNLDWTEADDAVDEVGMIPQLEDILVKVLANSDPNKHATKLFGADDPDGAEDYYDSIYMHSRLTTSAAQQLLAAKVEVCSILQVLSLEFVCACNAIPFLISLLVDGV